MGALLSPLIFSRQVTAERRPRPTPNTATAEESTSPRRNPRPRSRLPPLPSDRLPVLAGSARRRPYSTTFSAAAFDSDESISDDDWENYPREAEGRAGGAPESAESTARDLRNMAATGRRVIQPASSRLRAERMEAAAAAAAARGGDDAREDSPVSTGADLLAEVARMDAILETSNSPEPSRRRVAPREESVGMTLDELFGGWEDDGPPSQGASRLPLPSIGDIWTLLRPGQDLPSNTTTVPRLVAALNRSSSPSGFDRDGQDVHWPLISTTMRDLVSELSNRDGSLELLIRNQSSNTRSRNNVMAMVSDRARLFPPMAEAPTSSLLEGIWRTVDDDLLSEDSIIEDEEDVITAEPPAQGVRRRAGAFREDFDAPRLSSVFSDFSERQRSSARRRLADLEEADGAVVQSDLARAGRELSELRRRIQGSSGNSTAPGESPAASSSAPTPQSIFSSSEPTSSAPSPAMGSPSCLPDEPELPPPPPTTSAALAEAAVRAQRAIRPLPSSSSAASRSTLEARVAMLEARTAARRSAEEEPLRRSSAAARRLREYTSHLTASLDG